MALSKMKINKIIVLALKEDRAFNDISTKAVGASSARGRAKIIARQDGILCGIDIAREAFKAVDNKLRLSGSFKDSDRLKKGDVVLEIKGSQASILMAERTALNFLSHLSGISTLTSKFVERLKSATTRLLDTRKTLPGLRDLEKYAVVAGGGENHRRGLSDMYLLKENHISAAGGVENALRKALSHRRKVTSRRKGPAPAIEIEVTGLDELKRALDFDIERIMLDNFSVSMVRKAIDLAKKARNGKKWIELEVSGGINLGSIGKYARTGVDCISVGALTHSAPAFDFSLILDKR
ncbi:MAG: carboxylating nicotinate-nucleotide diphosphorylase [candidate division Zixibacteria bacterium]|nr:carboxylating nicotinate-nucleotide diphosphorylase [candidate division Zixibacteria bacterium]